MPAIKYSRQREAIQRFLMTRRDHPTADVVYSAVKREFPNISLGTVYRNLTLLADRGEIARLRIGDGVDHFDPDTSVHCHFVCTQCGRVLDLHLEKEMADSLTGLAGTAIDGNRIDGGTAYCYGVCSRCRRL